MNELTVHPTAEDLASYGPAMRALSLRRRKFVNALVSVTNSPADAARIAGYQGSREVLGETGRRLKNTQEVLDAIDEEARKTLYGAKLLATSVLVDIAGNKASKDGDRMRAAGMILNRVGMPEVFNQTITVEHKMTEKEKIQEIGDMAAKLGLDPKRLLGSIGVVDVEFTEVPAPAVMPAELEDLF